MSNQKLMSWEDAVTWVRNQSDQEELVRHCYYDDPISAAAERYYKSREWQAVCAYLPKHSGSALDIGAGRGISSFALDKTGWKVTALEPDLSDIVGSGAINQLISEARINIKVVNEWGESLPFSPQTFDLVYCRAVLHHARDLRQLCAEIERVLKPGGYLIATREHVISKKTDLPAFFESHPLHRLYGGECAYLLKEYKNAIKDSGLHLKRVINPFESDINLFPETKDSIKSRLSSKLKIIPKQLIPDFILNLYALYSRAPGRLYSFVAKKKS